MSVDLAHFLAGVFVVAVAGVLLIAGLNAYAPPQDLPWKPLRLDQPVGIATRWKLARTAEGAGTCRAFLAGSGMSFTTVAGSAKGFCVLSDAVQLDAAAARLASPPVMSCPLAAAYALWERQSVEPAAREILGSELKRIDHFGAYACRTLYGEAGAAPSEHARGAAVDIAGFELADGRRITVAANWNGGGREAAFLRRVRRDACGVFHTVLSPDYNSAHRDHLHLDMAAYSLCR